ncbi:MAG: hypothetical protein QHC65_14200 [Sphingomonas sp.]|nr:hypothetical protein [Sphingomonas sp.]MDX3885569.1 hypothetical protein [Sphingomonas sp.]
MSLTPEKLALKRASAEVVKGVGGYEAAAGFCRLGKTRLGQVCSTAHPDEFMPLDVLLDLEPLAKDRPGWPHVTRMLAKAQGFELFREPEVEPELGDWHEQMGELAEHSGAITSGLCAALKTDRRVTPNEVTEFGLIEQVDALIADAVKLRAMLRQVEANG